MLCRKPFMGGSTPFGCGQCRPCRINRRRQWMWRQYFESLSHEENCFVTLTYNEGALPERGTLEPEALRLFLMRLRKAVYPTRIRFFACGEYGSSREREWNPHYHLSLFGVSGRTDVLGKDRVRHHGVSELVQRAWSVDGKPLGFAYTAEFNEKTAQYVAGYVVKKLTAKDDPKLCGRYPEFARMSRRPGIGSAAMSIVADAYRDRRQGRDVPASLMFGKRQIPLGRFLLQKLRLAVGMTDEEIAAVKQVKSMEQSEELSAVFSRALSVAKAGEIVTFKSVYLAEIEQRLRQVEARAKLRETSRRALYEKV